MPKVVKHERRSTNFSIRPMSVEDYKIKLLLYGRSGTGKTTFWSTFPGKITVLICSGAVKSGELRSVNTPENRKRIGVVDIENSADVHALCAAVKEGDLDSGTVVLDHVTGLQDLILKEILGLDQLPAQKTWGLATQQQYGQCTLKCKEALRALLNLDCNVVIVAQEREFNTDTESDLLSPYVGAALTPSLVGWLNPACDYICQTFLRGKEEIVKSKVGEKTIETRRKIKGVEYCLRTSPDPVYITKFRVPRGRELPDAIVDPSYDKLVRLFE